MPRPPVHLYMPTKGVRDDFLALMNDFLELETVRFSEFSEVWRSKKMSCLCAGRQSDREAREFLERTFLIALDFFLPPYQFQVRVGGLYLLYSLYMTQPVEPGVKIRLTRGQWRETMHFQQEAAQQNHLDVVYVFNKLLQDHAFEFCYTASEMTSKAKCHETESSEVNLAEDMREDRRDIDRLFNYEAMEQLTYLLDHYQQMKVNLAGPEATQPDKSLDVVQGKMVEDLVSMLQSFKTSVANIQKHGKAEPAIDKNKKGQEQAVETTGSRRQALKAKAFSEIGKVGGRSTFVITVEDDTPSTEETQQQTSVDCQVEDSEVTSSNSFSTGRRTSRQLEDGGIHASTSKIRENTKRKATFKIGQILPECKVASCQQTIDDDVICVEVYSKSGTTRPDGHGAEGQDLNFSTGEKPQAKDAQSSTIHVDKEENLKETNLSTKDNRVKNSNTQEMNAIIVHKEKNLKSHAFQSDKVDASCYISCAGGRGTRVALPVFEDLGYPPTKSTSQSKKRKRSDMQDVKNVLILNDSSPSGSQEEKSEKSNEERNGKQSKALDPAPAGPCEKRSQQQSEKVDVDTCNKGRKGRKKKSASNEQSSASHSKTERQSPKPNYKKKDASALSEKESQNMSDKGLPDNTSQEPHDKESPTSRESNRVADTKRAESQNTPDASNKIQGLKKTIRNLKATKSPLVQASAQAVNCNSKVETLESPLSGIRINKQKEAATDLEREKNESTDEGVSKHNTKKVAVRKPTTKKQKVIGVEMKTSSETSSKRKRSLRESDSDSLNVSARAEGLSPPKKITPSKLKRKVSAVKLTDTNSDLPKVGKKSLKKSSEIRDGTKLNQTHIGKSGASPTVTVKEILVYREPNKATVFKESVDSIVTATAPSSSSGSRVAQTSVKGSGLQRGYPKGQQFVENITSPQKPSKEIMPGKVQIRYL